MRWISDGPDDDYMRVEDGPISKHLVFTIYEGLTCMDVMVDIEGVRELAELLNHWLDKEAE